MKKIDTSKSVVFGREMNDLKKSFEYLNKKGYFSTSKDFSHYEEGELNLVKVANFMWYPYEIGCDGDGDGFGFSYFIPKSKVVFIEEEEKELRPFKSMKEFFDVTGFHVGKIVHIKKVDDIEYEDTTIFNGFRIEADNIYIMLGCQIHHLDILMRHFKYHRDGKWQPFGIME